MPIKVRIYIDNKQIKSSDLRDLTIKNTTIDRIINDVVERNHQDDAKDIVKAS